MSKPLEFQPRIIRAGSAYRYCGMGRELFNEEIRPFVREIPIGQQGIGFDRLELDAALDEYIARRGHAPAQKWSDTSCRKTAMASASVAGSGISKRELMGDDFGSLLERAAG